MLGILAETNSINHRGASGTAPDLKYAENEHVAGIVHKLEALIGMPFRKSSTVPFTTREVI